MTSSNGNIFLVTGLLWGVFTGHRWTPHKGQWRGALIFSLICAWTNNWTNNPSHRWFETPSRSLWRHCNEKFKNKMLIKLVKTFPSRRKISILKNTGMYSTHTLCCFVRLSYFVVVEYSCTVVGSGQYYFIPHCVKLYSLSLCKCQKKSIQIAIRFDRKCYKLDVRFHVPISSRVPFYIKSALQIIHNFT